MAKAIKAKKIATGKPVKSTTGNSVLGKDLTAKNFIVQLKVHQSDDELKKIQRYFKSAEGDYGHGDKFMGVKMGTLFAIAKEFGETPIEEIEKLLESPIHEARAGAVSIMDKASRNKKISKERLKDFKNFKIARFFYSIPNS